MVNDNPGRLIPVAEFIRDANRDIYTPNTGTGYFVDEEYHKLSDVWDRYTGLPDTAVYVVWYAK